MSYKNPLLTKSFKAGGSGIAAYRFAKFGADDDHAIPAPAGTDAIIGVTGSVETGAEEPVDIDLVGIGEIELAATLARGAEVTSDSAGKAVAATAGDTVRGKILKSGVAGDIVPILLGV